MPSVLALPNVDHISDHDLECYYLGMVTDETELAPLEEHLLWCHDCVDRAERIEFDVDMVRIALLRAGEPEQTEARQRRRQLTRQRVPADLR